MSEVFAYQEVVPDNVPAEYVNDKARYTLGKKLFDALINSPPTVVELSRELRPAMPWQFHHEPMTEYCYRLQLTPVQHRNIVMPRMVYEARPPKRKKKKPAPLPWYARLGKFLKDEWDKTATIGQPQLAEPRR